jgi:hypothetical protein
MAKRDLLPQKGYYAKMHLMRFQAMSPEERMVHFTEVSGEMCSDEWREKFEEFTRNFPKDETSSRLPVNEEVFEHSNIEEFCVDPSKDLPGCRSCREAFWKLVVLTSMDW